jgi:hypothetical protein
LGGSPGTPDGTVAGSISWQALNPGSGGSGNHTGALTGARATQQGGAAGGVIQILCYGSVTIGNGNVFTANGGAPFAITAYTGGGGGGGAGGTIVLQAGGSLTIGTSSFSVNGSVGGNGSSTAGNGGAYGGGGGGGGYIIFGSLGPYTSAATTSLTGGAAGTSTGAPASRGCGGGANGGSGGVGGAGSAPTAGSSGQFFTGVYTL